MITKRLTRNNLILMLVLGIVYLTINIILNDAVLYVIGGVLGIVSEFLFSNTSPLLVSVIWLVLLILLIFGTFKVSNKWVYLLLLGLVFLFLYLIDFLLSTTIDLSNSPNYIFIVDCLLIIPKLFLFYLIYLLKPKKVNHSIKRFQE